MLKNIAIGALDINILQFFSFLVLTNIFFCTQVQISVFSIVTYN